MFAGVDPRRRSLGDEHLARVRGPVGHDDGRRAAREEARPHRAGEESEAPPVQAVQPTDPAPTEGGGAARPRPRPHRPPPSRPPQRLPPPSRRLLPPPAPEPGPTPAISIGTANGNPAVDAPSGAAVESGRHAEAAPVGRHADLRDDEHDDGDDLQGSDPVQRPHGRRSIWLQPRYALSEAFQLRGLLVFCYEFTNADDTVTKNEPRFSDTTLSLFYRKIPEIPGGIKPAVAISTSLPDVAGVARAHATSSRPASSPSSRRRSSTSPAAASTSSRAASYSHPFYRDTTAEVRTPAPYAFQCVGGDCCQDQLSGTFNVSDSVRYTLLVSAEWGKWSPALFYRGTSQWAYHGSDVRNPVDGTIVQSPTGFAPTSVRQSTYFSAWLDYNANSWLTAEVGYWLERSSALDGQAHYGNPFWDRYQDQRVFIGASFNIDNIMKQLEGGPTEAGIVRAQNKMGPIQSPLIVEPVRA